MTNNYKDRFTDAEKALQSQSAFICESCNKKYRKGEAEEKSYNCCGRTMKELLQEGFGP